MYWAIVNSENNLVENIIVPPVNLQDWVLPFGKVYIQTEDGAIDDKWDGIVFVKPDID